MRIKTNEIPSPDGSLFCQKFIVCRIESKSATHIKIKRIETVTGFDIKFVKSRDTTVMECEMLKLNSYTLSYGRSSAFLFKNCTLKVFPTTIKGVATARESFATTCKGVMTTRRGVAITIEAFATALKSFPTAHTGFVFACKAFDSTYKELDET